MEIDTSEEVADNCPTITINDFARHEQIVVDIEDVEDVEDDDDDDNDIPKKSKDAYLRTYNNLQTWKKSNNITGWSEDVLLLYFEDVKKIYSPITLKAIFTRLKITIKKYHTIDIGHYEQVMHFLKQNELGYKPKKSSVFKVNEIKKFIDTAPDYLYLAHKVGMILGVTGVCRGTDLWALELKNIKYFGNNKLTITLFNKVNQTNRVFTHKGVWSNNIKKYVDLRPQNTDTSRLFLNYQHGKCTKQPIGKNKISKWPCQIAKFLKLEKPEMYTGHGIRSTSTSLFAKRIKHIGSQKNSKIACIQSSTGKRNSFSSPTSPTPSSSSSNIYQKIVVQTTPVVKDENLKINETITNTNIDSLDVDPLNISDLTPPTPTPSSSSSSSSTQCHDNFSTSIPTSQETNYHFSKCNNYFSDETNREESNTLNDNQLIKLISSAELTEIKDELCDDITIIENDNNSSENIVNTLSTNCSEKIDEIQNNVTTIKQTTQSLINDIITDKQSNKNDDDDDNNYAKKEHEIKLKILNLQLERAEIQLQTARNDLNYSEINIKLIKAKANNYSL